jgi:hypothetical protein
MSLRPFSLFQIQTLALPADLLADVKSGQCGASPKETAERLSRSQAILNLMVSGVREGFDAVRALGDPFTRSPSEGSFPGCRVRTPLPTGAGSSRTEWQNTFSPDMSVTLQRKCGLLPADATSCSVRPASMLLL